MPNALIFHGAAWKSPACAAPPVLPAGPCARSEEKNRFTLMKTSFKQMLDVLQPQERRTFYLLVGVLLIVGLFETAGVASVLPFMAVLSEPNNIQKSHGLSLLYNTFGFTNTQNFLIFLGAGTFLVVMLGIFAQIFSLYAILRFSNARAYSLSSRLLRGYLHQPYTWFLSRHSSDLGKAVLSEVDSVVNQTYIPAMKLISNTFIAVLVAALLIFIQPFVALGAAVLLTVCYVGIFVVVRKWLVYYGQVRYETNRDRYRIAQEATGGIKDVKLLGLEDSYIRRFQRPGPGDVRGQYLQGCDQRGAALPAAGHCLRRHAAGHPRAACHRLGQSGRHSAHARGLCLRRTAAAAGPATDLWSVDGAALQPAGDAGPA